MNVCAGRCGEAAWLPLNRNVSWLSNMTRILIAALLTLGCNFAIADSADTASRISDGEARRIVRKAFAPVCGSDYEFRCPYALEDRHKRNCPFEAIVLLPLGENGTYDGRSRPAWISLAEDGAILAISYDKATACPRA